MWLYWYGDSSIKPLTYGRDGHAMEEGTLWLIKSWHRSHTGGGTGAVVTEFEPKLDEKGTRL